MPRFIKTNIWSDLLKVIDWESMGKGKIHLYGNKGTVKTLIDGCTSYVNENNNLYAG